MIKIKKKDDLYWRNFLWNSIAGLVNASESVVILVFCTRTLGMEEAGILTIAFAIANLMMAIGKFGMRTYQVTDADMQFDVYDYVTSRYITVCFMVVVSFAYEFGCIAKGRHSMYKAAVIILLCSIYAVEAMEDVFIGVCQKEGRLDFGNKVFIVRWIVIFTIYLSGFLLNGSLLVIEITALLFSVLVEVVGVRGIVKRLSLGKLQRKRGKLRQLFKQCAPLFAVAFLSLYITNAPKYAVDKYLSSVIQANYGFIFMPIFVISLLNSFLYQPILVDISALWENKDVARLKEAIARQMKWIILLTVFVLIAAFFGGIPFLNLLYNTSLTKYKLSFMILMLGGGMLSVVCYEVVLLTIMRSQLCIFIGYLAASFLGIVGLDICTKYYGILGNAIYYDLLMLMLMLIFGIRVYRQLQEQKGTEYAQSVL